VVWLKCLLVYHWARVYLDPYLSVRLSRGQKVACRCKAVCQIWFHSDHQLLCKQRFVVETCKSCLLWLVVWVVAGFIRFLNVQSAYGFLGCWHRRQSMKF
jgi:hypothetical protein